MGKLIENYSLQAELGSGAYSKVYRGINTVTKEEVAVKMIRASKFKEIPKLEAGIINEINILTNIEKCNHIVTYYDMLKTSNNFYFVYQYCNDGTLQMLLKKVGPLPEKQALLYLKQVLAAFRVLTKHNIMHRDIKPENILIKDGILKLADFGFCKPLESEDAVTATMLGSPVYMAPEVLKGEPYTMKADIWSLGVVLYRMLFDDCPFKSNSIAKLISTVENTDLHVPYYPQITQSLRQLIGRMLEKEPSKRIDWNEVFRYEITEEGNIICPKMLLQTCSAIKSSDDGLKKLKLSENQMKSSGQRFEAKVSCKTSFSNSTSDYEKHSTGANYGDSPQKPRFGVRGGSTNQNFDLRRAQIQSPRGVSGSGSGYPYSQSSSPVPQYGNLKNSENAFEKHSLQSYGAHSNHSDSQNKPSNYCSSISIGMSERYSRINVSLKNRAKCLDITSMAVELASYIFSEALVISYSLLKIVENELASMSELLKREIKVNYNSEWFNYELHEEFINAIEDELANLKSAIYAYNEEIPECILKDSRESDPKVNLKRLVGFLKLESVNELILISQVVDYMDEKMLIKRSTYEKLSKEQLLRQIKAKIARLNVQ